VKSAVFVSRAAPDDAAALAELAAECFTRPWTADQIRDEIALEPPNGVLVARAVAAGARAAPTAFCASRLVLDELHVLDLAVHPGWRRRGLGRFLLGLALRRAAGAGARVALLEVRAGNAPALALYAGLGFRPVGRRPAYYRDPVEDALLLERGGLQPRC
jgi:ribosomal-protein-alanine N-acetyltransferase